MSQKSTHLTHATTKTNKTIYISMLLIYWVKNIKYTQKLFLVATMEVGLKTLGKLSAYSCLISRIHNEITMERQLINPLKTVPSSHIFK